MAGYAVVNFAQECVNAIDCLGATIRDRVQRKCLWLGWFPLGILVGVITDGSLISSRRRASAGGLIRNDVGSLGGRLHRQSGDVRSSPHSSLLGSIKELINKDWTVLVKHIYRKNDLTKG
ncbi:hypothetical protein GH714_022638 [Hevea brasiliensis]|uniref:Uncharacterized protein n=1 Tax=Hevea brasiliensis TaxID=3981 RepID=A0A6A6MYF2_HEVBR|nr:hypothetical protein GH714_022638 [Hevea brasiliensis]